MNVACAAQALATGISARDLLTNECTKDNQCEAKLGKGATCKDQKCVAPPPPPPATGDKATQACKQYVTSTQTANPVQAGNNANGGESVVEFMSPHLAVLCDRVLSFASKSVFCERERVSNSCCCAGAGGAGGAGGKDGGAGGIGGDGGDGGKILQRIDQTSDNTANCILVDVKTGDITVQPVSWPRA